MVESHQKYARQRQNIVRGVLFIATRGTQALKALLTLSPVMTGIGARVLVSTARTERHQNLTTAQFLSTFMLTVVKPGQQFLGNE